jgi:C-terminal processing protease CtpA/Prc
MKLIAVRHTIKDIMKPKSLATILLAGLLAGCVAPKQPEEPAVCVPFEGVGVGLKLGVENQRVTIQEVFPNTPASRAGLFPGLIIQKIDGTATDDERLWKWVGMIRGEAGTKVSLELVDTGASRTNAVELIREKYLNVE